MQSWLWSLLGYFTFLTNMWISYLYDNVSFTTIYGYPFYTTYHEWIPLDVHSLYIYLISLNIIFLTWILVVVPTQKNIPQYLWSNTICHICCLQKSLSNLTTPCDTPPFFCCTDLVKDHSTMIYDGGSKIRKIVSWYRCFDGKRCCRKLGSVAPHVLFGRCFITAVDPTESF